MKKAIAGFAVLATVLLGAAGPASAKKMTPNQRFVISNVNDVGVVTASGPISGVGLDLEDSETHSTFKFTNGSVSITHIDSSSKDNFNDSTCTGRFSGKGNWTIDSGTGAYAGATGSGTYTFRGVASALKTKDGCDDNGGTFSFTANVKGWTNITPLSRR